MDKFLVIYPSQGLLGCIKSVVVGFKPMGRDTAELICKATQAKGRDERNRFDLAIIIPAYLSRGIWTAFVDKKHVPVSWKISAKHLPNLTKELS